MKKYKVIIFLISLLFIVTSPLFAQVTTFNLNKGWRVKRAGTNNYFKATVPGTVYTDLFTAGIILNPIFGDNEKNLGWIDTTTWEYSTSFKLTEKLASREFIQLVFEGLDTYTTVIFNDSLVLTTNNMFRKWQINVKPLLKEENKMRIIFYPALRITDSLAQVNLPAVLPDNNRVYARKAQFQFGWDWGPKFVNCGIWKNVYLKFEEEEPLFSMPVLPMAKLVQQKDSIGTSFYFEQKGKPIYVQGANWIPANVFLPEVKKEDYRKLLQRAKEANMNMLRVWGGGIYEDDYFYELCDEYNIMVWQDFMFAGGMYPADTGFVQNVKEEVRQQVNRLKKFSCIVLWCGNNEIDEAWKNWGWQNQFNIHGDDSVRLWQQYRSLFEDSIAHWVKEFDGNRPYISTSPKYGWGREQSFTEGDSHYWGLWWGLQPWESWKDHTGRFVSEWGMQSMPSYNVFKKIIPASDLYYNSPTIQWHQKANNGIGKLNFYLDTYFIDSACLSSLALPDYIYITQCLQYYILQNSIAIHKTQKQNMGTLIWQLNNCWPAISWSILNYDGSPRAAWYAVKNAYSVTTQNRTDSIYPKDLKLNDPEIQCWLSAPNELSVVAKSNAEYVFINTEMLSAELSDNYFSLQAGIIKRVNIKGRHLSATAVKNLEIKSWYDILKSMKSCKPNSKNR